MTPEEHHAEADRLIGVDARLEGPSSGNIALAQVHALLAQAPRPAPRGFRRAVTETGLTVWQHVTCSRVRAGRYLDEIPPGTCVCKEPGDWLPVYVGTPSGVPSPAEAWESR